MPMGVASMSFALLDALGLEDAHVGGRLLAGRPPP